MHEVLVSEPDRMSDILRRHHLFEGAPNDVVRSCAPFFVRRRYRKHSVLFDQGDVANGFYLLVAGKVRIGRVTLDGSEFTLAILGADDIIGDDVVFTRSPVHTSRAIVLRDAVLYYISSAELATTMGKCSTIMMNIARYAQERRADAIATLEDLSLRKVSDRLLRLLDRLRKTHGVLDKNGVRIDVRLTHAQIASLIGSTRETVSLELGHLMKNERVTCVRGYFIIPGGREHDEGSIMRMRAGDDFRWETG
jgi:CRP/FNR family transcriptional regulator, cyclic AMP receptor protein